MVKQDGEWIKSTMKNIDPVADLIENMSFEDYVRMTIALSKGGKNGRS